MEPQAQGGRRWINEYVANVTAVITNYSGSLPEEKKAMLKSFAAMFTVFSTLADAHLPIKDDKIDIDPANYEKITRDGKDYIVYPIIPAKTLLQTLINLAKNAANNIYVRSTSAQ